MNELGNRTGYGVSFRTTVSSCSILVSLRFLRSHKFRRIDRSDVIVLRGMYNGRSPPHARRQIVPSRRCSSCPAMRRSTWLWPEVAVKTLPRRSSSNPTPESAGMPSPTAIKRANTDPTESPTAFSLQVELLSRTPEQIMSASARLVSMIKHDTACQEGIRTAGGVRSAVTLLKLSQTAGNQRLTNAASRLLLHLARDNPRNQDEICTLEGIPCLVDVVLTFGRPGVESTTPTTEPQSPGRQLLEMTEAVRSAAVALGMLADRHARAIARAGGIKASDRASRTPSTSSSPTPDRVHLLTCFAHSPGAPLATRPRALQECRDCSGGHAVSYCVRRWGGGGRARAGGRGRYPFWPHVWRTGLSVGRAPVYLRVIYASQLKEQSPYLYSVPAAARLPTPLKTKTRHAPPRCAHVVRRETQSQAACGEHGCAQLHATLESVAAGTVVTSVKRSARGACRSLSYALPATYFPDKA